MENTMLRDLGEYIEQLVNGQVEPEIVEHEGVDYIRTSHGYEQLNKPKTLIKMHLMCLEFIHL